jgi:hypothetical protein
MPGGRERIEPEVTDISSHEELVQYAVAAQLAWLERHGSWAASRVAKAAELAKESKDAGSNLSGAIRNKRLTPDLLQRLDEVIATMAPELERTGGLCSFALRLPSERRASTDRKLTAYIPPSWTSEFLGLERPGDFGSLAQAAGLLSAFQAARRIPGGQGVERVRMRYEAELDKLVDRLVLISVAPPTARNIEAQIMLGSLASFAFGPIHEKLDAELRKQPLGFRVWRVVTKTVKLSASEYGAPLEELQPWVARLLRTAKEIRKASLYPGRSLDLELAITVPDRWVRPEDDWVAACLLDRAKDPDATIRERGTAAMGLWQRAVDTGPSGDKADKARQTLKELVSEFRDEAARPDAATGIQWVATTLEYLMATQQPVCNEWPAEDQQWRRNVDVAAQELDRSGLPPHLLKGTKRLFEHILLQNAGVYRRQAIETVTTGGWNVPIARALGELLKIEEQESWLRIRALFALGFLQVMDDRAVEDLTQACRHAYENLLREPTRAQVTEMHAALFAVGDCFGGEDQAARTHAQAARESLGAILRGLTTCTNPEKLHPAARAAAYMLTFTAQPREKHHDGDRDLSEELLMQLRKHEDPLTRRMAEWALSFRFADRGDNKERRVRPLLEAARFGTRFAEPPRFGPELL